VVFDVFVCMSCSLSEIVQPERLHRSIFGHEHSASALSTQTSVHGDGIEVDGTISWCRTIGRDSHRRNVGDRRLCYNNPQVLIEAEEDSFGPLLDCLCAELCALHGCLNKFRIVLYDRVVLQRVHKDHLSVHDYRVGHCDRYVAQVIRNHSS